MSDYDLRGNLDGFTYQQLLNWALEECESFSVVSREGEDSDSEQEVIESLKPFLIEEVLTNKWPGTEVFSKPVHVLRFYKLNSKSVSVLSEAGSLFSWLSPDRPEDLAFYKKDRRVWFGSVAHENMAFFVRPSFSKSEVSKRLVDVAVQN